MLLNENLFEDIELNKKDEDYERPGYDDMYLVSWSDKLGDYHEAKVKAKYPQDAIDKIKKYKNVDKIEDCKKIDMFTSPKRIRKAELIKSENESLDEELDAEDVYFKLLHFIDDLGYDSEVARNFYQIDDVMSALKALLDRLEKYNKNESLDEAKEEDEKPYNKDEVHEELMSITKNWSKESGDIKVWYDEELKHVKDLLSDHYEHVETSRGPQGWKVVAYKTPKKED